jgi:large subunit ribosomal protein L24
MIARGDSVIVTKGRDKDKRGTVKRVLDNGRVQIEKVMMIKRHLRPSQKDPQGGIQDREGTVAIASVALWCDKCGKAVRSRAKVDGDKKVRACADCGGAFPSPGMK